MTWQQRLNLRHEIYFSLSLRQKRMFHSLGYESNTVENITMTEFLKITKNKELTEKLCQLKRSSIYLLKAG